MPTRRDAILGMAALLPFPAHAAATIDVRDHGARGDGRALDSPAFNAAIAAAAARPHGGTMLVPASRYRCYSIRLRSRVTIVLAKGAIIEAATGTGYDLPEDNGDQLYQDFGHSHWRNSLFWGEDIEDAAITGPGLIHGIGLTRDGPGARWKAQTGERPLSMRQMSAEEIARLEPDAARMNGLGNKAIALRNGRNIRLSGFTMLKCGHFAILATGTQHLTIEDLSIDTDRDGIDLDCVRDVLVERCRVNTPNDDAIVVKSSYALGRRQAAENVVIRRCAVSGYDLGTMLDGSRRTTQVMAPDRDRPTGRIKLGTESNGGFRNIAISNCVFEDSRGLAFETVDGAMIEDVAVSNITMRGIVDAPLFLRLGKRMRGPKGRAIGTMRRIRIQNLVSSNATMLPSVIAGLVGHPIEDVAISDMHLHHVGGAPAAMARLQPPEEELGYPEATMFGDLPATGLFARHVRGLSLRNVEVAVAAPDPRPAVRLEDVAGVDAFRMAVPAGVGFSLHDVSGFRSFGSRILPDRTIAGPFTGDIG